nr:hypothetical protein P5652_18520 [Bacillus subtilis]
MYAVMAAKWYPGCGGGTAKGVSVCSWHRGARSAKLAETSAGYRYVR